MDVIWYKVWRDLWGNKLRTLLVVLSTAVGVMALGLVYGLAGKVNARMSQDLWAAIPAHITFEGGPFSQEVVDAVQREAGVEGAEGELVTSFRWKMESETDWRTADLVARADYEDQRMNLAELRAGHWPLDRELAPERQSDDYFGLPADETVLVEFKKRERRLPLSGVIRMPILQFPIIMPPEYSGRASFFATTETVAWLTGYQGFSHLHVRLESYGEERAHQVARQIEKRLEGMGAFSSGYTVITPGVYWAQEIMNGVFLVLQILGVLSLGLSVFLIVNTMNALVAQQLWQIGVMKVTGATFDLVMSVYLVGALVYGLLALPVAVPLGAAGAHLMTGELLSTFNIDRGSFRLMPAAVGIQLAVGLCVPLLAALVPVISGARVTPHQAISSYGLGGGFGRSPLDRFMGRIRHLPRPLALSLRNTFRRKARVALTLFTLTLGGAMFIVVMSVRGSMYNTMDVLLNEFDFDVMIILDRPQRAGRLVEVTQGIPGVARAEVWDRRPAMLSLSSGGKNEVYLWSPPADSGLFNPRVLSGRGLVAGDSRAILLNRRVTRQEQIELGDEIELTIGGRESAWTVVGISLSLTDANRASFVPFDSLAQELGIVNRGTIVMVQGERQEAVNHTTLAQALDEAYAAHNIKVFYMWNADDLRSQMRASFDMLISLLMSMAILAAVVGSIGLMGTMSINVVERRREIGVMRAIGATSADIGGVFVGEGVMLGLISWLLALPVSYPGARAFSHALGEAAFDAPFDFLYSVDGVLLWLAIVVVLSALASLWPALQATRVSVRESLAYE